MTLSHVMDTVKIERAIQAAPARVFAALTTREGLISWLCDTAFVDAEAGRPYLVIWRQEQVHASGTYLEVEQDKKLAFSWRGKNEQVESTVKIQLTEQNGHTAITLIHEDLPDQAAVEAYQNEWERGLDKLKQYVETGALPNIVNRVIVGIRPGAVNAEQAQALGLEAGAGTFVTDLVAGYSAEKAGIKAGDIITALDGKAVTAQAPMNVLTQGRKPGEKIAVTFYRDGAEQTLTMELKGYPVPAIPETFAALADHIQQEYSKIEQDFVEIFMGVTDVQARQRPAAGEWSADHVLAHLICSERYLQDELGGRVTGGMPQHWSGNDDVRLNALLTVHLTHTALLAELKRLMAETVAILRNFPEAATSPATLWGSTFNFDYWLSHTRGHYHQIRAALTAAKSM